MPIIQGTNAFILVDDVSGRESRNRCFSKGSAGSTDRSDTSGKVFLRVDGGSRRTRATCEKVFSDTGVLVPRSRVKHSIRVIYVEGCDRDDGLKLLEIFSSGRPRRSERVSAFLVAYQKRNSLHYVCLNNYLDTIEALPQSG